MLDQFDYASYRALLQRLVTTHRDLRFVDVPPNADRPDRYFILRHDVDFTPDAALSMARLEAEAGVRASYFLLLASPLYNLLEPRWRGVPRALTDLGHEVGLHYDVAAYARVQGVEPRRSLLAEVQMLSSLAGAEVTSIAMHNPSVSGEDPFHGLPQFRNAYADEFTKEMTYLSDSGGAWRNKAVAALVRGDIPPRLQLLIHPFFWTESHADRWARLESFCAAKSEELMSFAEVIRAGWRSHSGVTEHDVRNDGDR